MIILLNLVQFVVVHFEVASIRIQLICGRFYQLSDVLLDGGFHLRWFCDSS